jgi:hypothetical protein
MARPLFAVFPPFQGKKIAKPGVPILRIHQRDAITLWRARNHDDGWDGFPLDKNPYVAQGSRSMFGYSLLFTPSIPLFMSGEEFNADYIPLPAHAPDLYGKGGPGKGRWLYASMIESSLNRTGPRAAGWPCSKLKA